MKSDLFKSILAMDSYNRGYNPGIKFGSLLGDQSLDTQGTKIGNAIIYKTLGNIDARAISFYGIAYDLDGSPGGEVTIAYRGTDDPLGLSGDILNGWVAGAGILGTQADMAFAFYKSVAGTGIDPRTANISLTGHSLGGGLAGLVGGVYGKSGLLFDNMGFEAAADSARRYSDPALAPVLPGGGSAYSAGMRTLVYGSPTASVWANNFTKLKTEYVAGEVLTPFRSLQTTPKTSLSLGNSVNLPDTLGVDEHSMSTLVIQKFSQETSWVSSEDWKVSARYFWPELYDGNLAKQIIGNGTAVSGNLLEEAKSGQIEKYSDILRTIIAYSAIDEGTRLFGDTGIRALYDDANELGKALGTMGGSTALTAHADDIAKSFVQFAGTLALNKILMEQKPEMLSGVVALSGVGANHTLSVNFSEALWRSANGGVLPAMPGRTDLVGELYAETGNAAGLRQTTLRFWGDGTTNAIDRVVFATGEAGTYTITNTELTNKGTFFIGGSGNDTVSGSGSHELFNTGTGDDNVNAGDGNDIILGSAGNDVINGGLGNDTVDYSGATSGVTIDKNNVIYDGFGGSDTLSGIDNIVLSRFDDTLIRGSISPGKQSYIGGAGNDTITLTNAVHDTGKGLYLDSNATGRAEISGFETVNIQTRLTLPPLSGAWSYKPSGWSQSLDYSSATSSLTFDLVAAEFSEVNGGGYVGQRNGRVTGNDFTHTIESDYGRVASIQGSHFGDTYYTNWFSHSYSLITGRGNDTVYIQPASSDKFTIHYSGGNDVYYATADLDKIRLDPSILLSDISNITVTSSGLRGDFIAKLTITGYGLLTINYDDLWPDTLPVLLGSGGRITFNSGSTAYSITGTSSVQATLYGTWGDDTWSSRAGYGQTYYAKGGNDTVYGNDGNDNLYGGEGADRLYGGDGNDVLEGNFGNDTLEGGNGDDTLRGGWDNDVLVGGSGSNALQGEEGNDTYRLAANSRNSIQDSLGTNTLVVPIIQSEMLISYLANYVEFYNTSRSFAATIQGYQSFSNVTFSNGTTVSMTSLLGVLPVIAPYNGSNANDSVSAASATAGVSSRLYGGNDGFSGSIYADVVYGDDGSDVLNGGGGNDWLYGGAQNDSLNGGTENDNIFGGIGDDSLSGNEGNDILTGEVGKDNLWGGTGDDTFVLYANDSLFGQEDVIYELPGEGTDTIKLAGGIVPSQVYTWATNSGGLYIQYSPTDRILVSGQQIRNAGELTGVQFSIEKVFFDNGTVWDLSGALKLNDTDEAHVISGSPLGDTIAANGGDDTVYGGTGNDGITGGEGNDKLVGYIGLFAPDLGTADHDVLDGGKGQDTLEGVWGDDVYVFRTGDSPAARPDTIYEVVSQGTDTIKLTGGIVPSQVMFSKKSTEFFYRLKFGASDEIFLVNYAPNGSGMSSTNTLAFEKLAFDNGTVLNLAEILNKGPIYLATSGNDTIDASTAFAGITVDLLAGNDIAKGSNFNDSIIAGDGNDTVEGRAGNDILNGGVGTDTVSYASAPSAVTVNLSVTASQNTVGAGSDTISNFENLTGSAYNDTLTGNSTANTLRGGNGNDLISGGSGDDLLYGGNDLDEILGGIGNDVLYGEVGNDLIIGGAGLNKLSGGTGDDKFVFQKANAFDTPDEILDFKTSEGDKLDIADILDLHNPVTDAIAGFVRITETGTNSFLSIDADGGANNFVTIAQFTGVTNLTAGSTATEAELKALVTNGSLIL